MVKVDYLYMIYMMNLKTIVLYVVNRDDVERLMAKLMKDFGFQYVKQGGQCIYKGLALKNK